MQIQSLTAGGAHGKAEVTPEHKHLSASVRHCCCPSQLSRNTWSPARFSNCCDIYKLMLSHVCLRYISVIIALGIV